MLFNSSYTWVKVLLFLSAGFIVYIASRAPDVPATADKIERKVATVSTHTSARQVVTTKPDGTQVRETTVVVDSTKVASETSDTHISAAAAKARYRIGVDFLPSIDRAPAATDLSVRAAARLGDSAIWLEGGIDVKHKQVTIGASMEF